MRNIFIQLLLLLSYSASASTADSTRRIYSGFQAHYGFIIPHSKAIQDIAGTNPFGFEVSRNKLRTSLSDWQVFNTYWISGIEARYFNFQNPEILGGVFDISVFAEPVVRHGNNYLFTIRGGAGVSYHTKIYDELENPLNQFFSSKISFPLFLDARFKYKIGDRTLFTLSACYNHISNGGVRQPNKGMNFPTLSAGLERYHKPFPVLNDNFTPIRRAGETKAFLLIQAITSVKVLGEKDSYPEKAKFIYGLHSRITKPLGPFYALNSGVEMIFDGYVKETIKREQSGLDYKRVALTFGQDFMLGEMVFTQYLGLYLYSPFKAENLVYQKYELAYRLNRNLRLGFYLKAHLQVAELMGVNINYILRL